MYTFQTSLIQNIPFDCTTSHLGKKRTQLIFREIIRPRQSFPFEVYSFNKTLTFYQSRNEYIRTSEITFLNIIWTQGSEIAQVHSDIRDNL